MPIKVLELHHHGIRIGTTDDEVEQARNFYTDVLGIPADSGRLAPEKPCADRHLSLSSPHPDGVLGVSVHLATGPWSTGTVLRAGYPPAATVGASAPLEPADRSLVLW